MKLTSPAFKEGGKIPRKYSCQGDDINPELVFSDVPENAKSLALIIDDPDVPVNVRKDRMWVHFVQFNIDPKTKTISENAKPIGVMGSNTSGKREYMGPCPPDREHRYFFKLYALDMVLKLEAGSTKDELLGAMQGHIIAEAQLMGRYEKS